MAVERKLPRNHHSNAKLAEDENLNVAGTGLPSEMGIAQVIRDQHYDELMQGRCPKCNTLMTPRMGRDGPYFHCQCKPRAKLQAERLEDRS